jgi:hypothetical protein
MKVKWDDGIPNILKNIKCSKPPTSYHCLFKKKNGFTQSHLMNNEKVEKSARAWADSE